MVKRKKDDKRFEKALGLISLAADNTNRGGHEKGETCPSFEMLAALLDNNCSADEKARLKEHLSSCEGCYQQWLTFSTLQLAGSKAGNTDSFRKKKKYTYIGSALVLAASVALYLNVVNDNIVSVDKITSAQEEGKIVQFNKEKRVVERNVIELKDWRYRVVRLCRFPQAEMGNLPKLIGDGRRLLMHHHLTGAVEEVQSVVPITLFLLERLEASYQPDVCKEIVATLAQHNKSR